MEIKKYSIDNSNCLFLDGSDTEIKIISGHAYLFLSKKLADGRTGARHEIGDYNPGDVCPNIPGNEKYAVILCGISGTEVEVIKASAADACEKALELQKKIIADFENNEKEEKQRSIKQQKLSEGNYSKAIENIASVVNKREEDKTIFDAEDQQMVKVFKVLSKHINDFSVRAVPGKIYKSDKSGIQGLAKDNTIRVREVVLRDKWYNEDNGSLVAFYCPDAEFNISEPFENASGVVPVALIRNNTKNKYFVVNPESDEKIPVTASNAKHIYPMAHMLYKAMNEQKINLKSICTFVLKDIKRDIVRYVVIGLLCTLIGLITPYITRNLIDTVIPNAAKNQAIQICVLVFICNISSMIGSLAKYFANLRMETIADSDLEAAVIDRLLKLPVDFFKEYSSGDLAARTMAITTARKKVFDIILTCFMNFIYSFVYLIQEFRFCGYFAKWGILFCIVPILISLIISLITYKMEKELLDSSGKIQGMLLQFLNGIQKISNSNSEKRVFSVWSKEYIRQTKIGYKISSIGIISRIISSLYPTIVTIIMYYLFGRAMQLRKVEGLTTGTFLAFTSAYGCFQSAFMGLAGALISIRDLVPLTKRIKPILDQEPEIQENKPPIDNIKGNVEISHLNFRYEEKSPLVLKDINMTIKEGEFVAIVGTSGAGKSTLLRMLLGFEKPESGSIFVDNQDINSIDIGSLRRQMGVVLQKDSVLQGTILQNIVGSSGLKEEDAWEAARKVSFDKDIEEMPMGMFTMVPAGGSTLSGGQLQRLIIARAIIRNPKLLIFDEATSALDNMTQLTVRKSLDELKVTRIIIAHRLSTIINADKIYVMKDGEVIETGNYESLMAQNGYFTQLEKRQSV